MAPNGMLVSLDTALFNVPSADAPQRFHCHICYRYAEYVVTVQKSSLIENLACRMIADGITINEDGTFAEPPTTAPPATAPPATEPPARRIKRMIVAMRTRSIFGFH